jgi:hypothetical protein
MLSMTSLLWVAELPVSRSSTRTVAYLSQVVDNGTSINDLMKPKVITV